MRQWYIYLNDRFVDSVFYTLGCDADYVRQSLIDHDRMDSSIMIVSALLAS